MRDSYSFPDGRLADHHIGDSFSCVSIPQRRDRALFRLAREHLLQLRAQLRGIAPHEDVRPHRHRNRPLGIFAHGKARDVQIRGLFLDPTGISDYHRSARLQREKIEAEQSEFKLTVDKLPAQAGIDPLNKLIDRNPDDNVITVAKK